MRTSHVLLARLCAVKKAAVRSKEGGWRPSSSSDLAAALIDSGSIRIHGCIGTLRCMDSLADKLSRTLLALRTRPPHELENQTLEIKGWCPSARELGTKLADAAMCLTNAEGGMVLVGIDDKATSTATLGACPHVEVCPEWAVARIRELTKPPVRCRVVRVEDVLPQHQGTLIGALLAIEVGRTEHPGLHRNSRGICLVRNQNQCPPEYFTHADDFTDSWWDAASAQELCPESLAYAAGRRGQKVPDTGDMHATPMEHALGVGLLRRVPASPDRPKDSIDLSVAGLVLLGTAESIKARLHAAETCVIIESRLGTTAPMTSHAWHSLPRAVVQLVPLLMGHMQAHRTEVPEDAIFELVVNAYIHRDYRTEAPVQVRVTPDEVTIINPGGLLGGLTVGSIMTATPIYRNFKLADAARQFGLCDKAGIGIDRVFRLLLQEGYDFPVFSSANNMFSVSIRLRRDRAFGRFIRDNTGTLSLRPTDLIVLRALRNGEKLAPQLGLLAQQTDEYMMECLKDMQRRSLISASGDLLRLSPDVVTQLNRYESDGQLSLFR